MPAWFLLIATIMVADVPSLSAQPRLVKDINETLSPVGSTPVGLRSIGDVTFFFAHQAQTGYELWKTDGTEGGTTLVRDLFPGPSSGVAPDFAAAVVLGSRLIFVATDGVEWGFWATDGTAQGTVRLGSAGVLDFPAFGPVIGSTFYFTAVDAESTARELWRTDGTPAGTRTVLDRNTAIARNGMAMIAPLGSLLLLSGFDGTNSGIFTTDGTAEGTRFVAPFLTTPGVSLVDAVLFAHRADTGLQLMRTDGTAAGTTVLRSGFTRINTFLVMSGVAYFTATDPVNGNALWRSDGTVEGTSLADLIPGAAASQITLSAVLGNRLLFTTTGNLWVSDGTAAGTRIVKPLPYVSGGAVSGNQFYFVSEDAVSGRELWKTDGTTEGTTRVFDVNPGPGGSIDSATLVARPGGVFFAADDRVRGREPWITDGTSAGTRMVRNVAPDTRNGSQPRGLANVGGRLVFQAFGGGSPLWTSDGTPEGTSRLDVPALDPGPAMASGGLYYFVNGQAPALELWRTDGTVAGTVRLTTGDSRFVEGMSAINGGVFFSGYDPQHGAEPWFTDGTVAGTRLLQDVHPGTRSGYGHGSGTFAAEGTVAFPAEGAGGREVWLTDGTSAGTRRLMMLLDNTWSSLPSAFTKFGDAFYFLGTRHGEPLTLWRADPVTGTFAAVHRITGQLSWTSIWTVDGAMLFTGGKELWRSDGTEAGTVRIHEAVSLPDCFNREDFLVGGGLLYWYAQSGLWRSDGTDVGTFRLAPAVTHGCLPHADLHYSDGRLYFSGTAGFDAEPWVTDGSLVGTRLLWDVNPGPASSGPASFLRIGRTLFFAASEPSAGRELWAMETGCEGPCPSRRRSARH